MAKNALIICLVEAGGVNLACLFTMCLVMDGGAATERTSSCMIAGKATCESIVHTLAVKSAGTTVVNETLWRAGICISASWSISAASNKWCGYKDRAL
uniref:Secreted protein n=1 Tax=Romanomermis culicivorax TaxID=13658 RepID=A0A915JID8_ROMCU